jgi:TonB-dependent starch-binding outer membrane protein SusC
MTHKLLSICLFVSLLASSAWAQSRQVSGKVTSKDDGLAMPGVNVLIQGTAKGTTTDLEGNFNIQLDPGENTIVFTFVGYKSLVMEVGAQTQLNVSLETDITALEEVVVVGYGTQREKDLTSAIVTIKTDEIVKTPTNQAMQALQGKIPGVQIVSNGQPGAGPTVRVRGLGSFPGEGSPDPLYVVDGMFFDNIDFLNTADIESISVLKDASASAIYGVRAANGVVLIQTKSGSYNSKSEITYDGYYGVQVAQNVLKMANAEQFTRYALETGSSADASFIDNAFQRYGRSRVNPNVPNVNTDWYDQVLRTAPIQSHSIGISGGKDNVRYSIGTSYFSQDGIMEGMRNSYERLNLRARLDFKASDKLTVGGNVNLSNAQQYRADNAVWFNTFFAVPILPVFDELNTDATPVRYANAQDLGYRNPQNPFFILNNSDDRSNIGKVLGNFYFDYQVIPKLSFKMAYNYSFENIVERNVDLDYNDGVTNRLNSLERKSSTYFNQILDNTLTYTNDFGNHNVTAMLGYSFRSEQNEISTVRGQGIPTLDRDEEATWYIPSGQSVDRDGSRDNGGREFGASYFGRIAYNYKDKYLFYTTLRRDGTNKFQQKWGNFLTIGAGWIISEEEFFQASFVDFLKLRGSWGELGNDGVDAAVGQATVSSISTAIADALAQGLVVDNTFDLVDRWERKRETNIGISARFLNNRLSMEADYYIRDTKEAVTTVRLPSSGDIIRRNVGEIRNSGIEMALNWNGKISADISYTIGGNIGTLKNEVLSLGGQQYIDVGQAEFRQRSIVGESINSFYGYEVVGVFQTQDQINNSGYTSEFITQRGLIPGDFWFKDQNGDGVIDGADRKVIGKILPTVTYGFNLGATYRNFDLSVNIQGQAGHDILNRKRGEIIFTTDTNIDADLANNLWRGEGTSNKYPSAAGLRKTWNLNMSEYFVERGSYFRIQNIRLGYRISNRELFGVRVPDTRIIFTAERPLTVFNYNGFNPEVADGIDRQTYPIPAVYTLGLNVKF